MVMSGNENLVDISLTHVVLCLAPLVLVCLVSVSMDLKLESPLIVGCFRTFIQLTILALILKPIFVWGENYWQVVVVYTFFMVFLTSYESVQRSAYYFSNMFFYILGTFIVNVGVVAIFAFGVIVRPEPIWNPQYVIPMLGMLLGNCINGASLSLNAMLTSLVENASEVELLLSFGADCNEACSRLFRESVRTGALPLLNSMALIGLIFIPGMMTGQILGGSEVMEAARYQMIIMYLIAFCTFGVIVMEVFVVLRVGFDFEKDMLRTDRFMKRKQKRSFVETVGDLITSLFPGRRSDDRPNNKGDRMSIGEMDALFDKTLSEEDGLASYESTGATRKGKLKVSTLSSATTTFDAAPFEVSQLECSFEVPGSNNRCIIFENVSFTVRPGEIALVSGPSGAGKSTLLRVLSGLRPMDGGDIWRGATLQTTTGYSDYTAWRRETRYVTQYKVSIPGTPIDFVRRFTSFQSWRKPASISTPTGDTTSAKESDTAETTTFSQLPPPSKSEVLACCRQLLQQWDMELSDLEKEWSQLSGGEAQRILVALALASKPQVLLMDESTSSLDLDVKQKVERSVQEHATKYGMSVLWITHDVEQIQRMKR
ncbi:hypothetical protein ACA910_001351 [Epithemia clementina (nom. ined.)]